MWDMKDLKLRNIIRENWSGDKDRTWDRTEGREHGEPPIGCRGKVESEEKARVVKKHRTSARRSCIVIRFLNYDTTRCLLANV